MNRNRGETRPHGAGARRYVKLLCGHIVGFDGCCKVIAPNVFCNTCDTLVKVLEEMNKPEVIL